jgi:DNA recombination protein RmuC
MTILLTALCVLVLTNIVLAFIFRSKSTGDQTISGKIEDMEIRLNRIESNLKDDFRINREENSAQMKTNREELKTSVKEFQEANTTSHEKMTSTFEAKLRLLTETSGKNSKESRDEFTKNVKDFSDSNVKALEKITLKLEEKLKELTEQSKSDDNLMREALVKRFSEFQEVFDKNIQSFNERQREHFSDFGKRHDAMVQSNEKKLEAIQKTVGEKLEETLKERLGQSFETVSKQLIEVQKGLGEMQTLAQDVGGLKKVLSNVKMRGGLGEVQLSLLLEQILAPEQYEANVKTKKGSADLVEFAIKLPGKDDNNSVVWLPIDAKFPKDAYEQLQNAYDAGDLPLIDLAQRNLEATIKKMARDICDKYLDPPNTTDFGIMFLPFEGIYAEVVRKASLLEDLQRNFKVSIAGPSTLAAFLNSLQMGFRTLTIQKRSSEVWKVLGEVKKEFETFGGLLEKAQNNIQVGLNQLDQVRSTRTSAIQRKLRGVETVHEVNPTISLPEEANEIAIPVENI